MTYRFMRVLVLFDLPTTSSKDLREYRKFRKTLIKDGFSMLQQSVYTKIALNRNMADSIIKKLEKNKPAKGLVQVLSITEKQFASMVMLVGEYKTDTINTDERIVIL